MDKPPAAFAYSDFGPAGRIVQSERVKDLDVTLSRFENGVRLNFKATAFDAGTVSVCVRVGNGRLSQPESKPGLDLLANAIVPVGGLGRHSVEELQDILAGHTLSVSFAVDSDALDFNARCAREDLGLCLKVIAAYLTDMGYRPEGLPQAKASVAGLYASLASSPAGPISMYSTRILSGGDRRFGVATGTEYGARTIAEVRDWIGPQLTGGPIEMSIVGDTTWEEASAGVAATLGALPRRAGRSEVVAAQVLNAPRKPSKPVYIFTTDPSLRQVAVAWFCPVHDLSGVHMERRCRLLAALMAERIRVRLRVELGAAYGFDADFVQNEGFPDFSYFTVYTAVAPEHARATNDLIGSEMQSLRRGRFTRDEFERVKLPFLSKREEDLRDNGYWSYTVLRDAQQRPERIESARDRQADCASITPADIEALGDLYLDDSRWFQFVAYPHLPSAFRPPVNTFDSGAKLGPVH